MNRTPENHTGKHTRRHGGGGNHGFTLMEMLIVIGIIGILAGLVTVMLADRTEYAEEQKSDAHLSQIIRLIEQETTIGSSTTDVAEALRDASYKPWEKLWGATEYIKKHVKTGTDNCNPPVGVTGHITGKPVGAVYTFLDIIDGPGKTPVVLTGAIPPNAPKDTIYCAHAGSRGLSNVHYFVNKANHGWTRLGPL